MLCGSPSCVRYCAVHTPIRKQQLHTWTRVMRVRTTVSARVFLCAVLTPIRKKDHVVKNRVVENCVWFTVEVYRWCVKVTCCSFHHIPEKTITIRHACTCTKPDHKILYARGFACEHMHARAVLLMPYPERSPVSYTHRTLPTIRLV